jgi:protease II
VTRDGKTLAWTDDTVGNDNLLVFETDWKAGHAGKSGRYGALREPARAYAFMLYVLGGAGAR